MKTIAIFYIIITGGAFLFIFWYGFAIQIGKQDTNTYFSITRTAISERVQSFREKIRERRAREAKRLNNQKRNTPKPGAPGGNFRKYFIGT